jgi:hypothetical protein
MYGTGRGGDARPPCAKLPACDAHRIYRVEMPRAHPRWGIEFDWLGVDPQDHVAVFTTAGYGPVPVHVNQHAADLDTALDQVRRLPVTGSAGNVAQRPADGDHSDSHAYSGRGFYVYDWQLWHGPYQRLSSPTVRVSISQLPSGLLAVAHFAEFPVSFADEPDISIEYIEPPDPDTGQTLAT